MKIPKKFFKGVKTTKIAARVESPVIVSPKEQKIQTFGNKSLNIRELIVSRDFWLWVSIWFATLLILYFSLQVGNSFQKWENIQMQRSEMTSKANLWEGILGQYPNYQSAYFEAAILAYRLGNFGKTLDLLQKLSVIDPGFPYAKKLEMLTRIQ